MLCTGKVLGKSVKPIPVMILGVLLARKKYPWLKYLFVLMITTGVALFMYKPSKVQTSSESSPLFGWGELLLVCINKFTETIIRVHISLEDLTHPMKAGIG